MLFPTSYRKAYHWYDEEQTENANVVMRAEVVKELGSGRPLTVVSYAEALSEKVVSAGTLGRNTLRLSRGMKMEMDALIDRLQELGFEREDFVVERGQYAVRGGIVDVYSYASDLPVRVEFFDEEIDSLRTYDAVTQLSVKQLDRAEVVANLSQHDGESTSTRVSLLEYFS
jgi:transcription-repair coupling factor (superfamily II helicase)